MIFPFVNVPALELRVRRGNDDPVTDRSKSVEEVVGEVESPVEAGLRCRDVHEELLVGFEIGPLVDRTTMPKMSLGFAN
jgi:hypothetical protein